MAMKKASIPGINQRLEGCVEEVDGHEEGEHGGLYSDEGEGGPHGTEAGQPGQLAPQLLHLSSLKLEGALHEKIKVESCSLTSL